MLRVEKRVRRGCACSGSHWHPQSVPLFSCTAAGSTGLSPAPWYLVGVSVPSPGFWIKLGDLNLALTKRAVALACAQIWGYEREALRSLGAVFSSPPTVRIHLISIMTQYRIQTHLRPELHEIVPSLNAMHSNNFYSIS